MALRVPLPDPARPVSWATQIALERVDANTFRSLHGAPFGNFIERDGEQRPRAFGGHVYAQASYAASKTVKPGFLIHSITGYFLVLGLADEPFIYDVKVVRDGNNYQVRRIEVTQSNKVLVFSAICSFKKIDESFLNIQVRRNPEKDFSALLGGRKVKDLPLLKVAKDLRTAYTTQVPSLTTTFPGMLTSVLPLDSFHAAQKEIMHRRNMYVYSTVDDSDTAPDPNRDACAHMYHSDRESVWGILRQYELFDVMDAAASLSHTVIFHAPPSQLRFKDDQGNKRWFYLTTGSKRVSDGRGLHKGAIYDEDGNHIATTMQDGSIRLRWDSEDQKLEKQEKILSSSKSRL